MTGTVLVLRALGIGDLATAVPALRGLRAAHPDARVTLAAPAWLAPVAALTGAVDELVPVAGLATPPRHVPPPMVAVNLHGRGPQSHRLLTELNPGRLLGFRTAEYPDGPQWREDEHEVRRWCRLLHWYGIPTDPGDLTLRVPAAPAVHSGATIVHPGSTSAQRRWPAPRFAAVARRLAGDGHHVLLTGGPGEVDLARSVARGAGLPADRVLAGRTGLADLAALVAAARLVVSGDTGVAHLATGYRVPSVVLFGPVPPRWWGPPPDRPWHRALYHGDAVDQRTAVDAPLLAIGVPEVLAAVGDVLAAGTRAAVRPDRRAAVRAASPGSG
jgi:ADP-heptose:LPS heptosyltransferase